MILIMPLMPFNMLEAQVLRISEEMEELCPYWKDKEFREPYVIIIPPKKEGGEWKCRIECRHSMNYENFTRAFIPNCDKCSNSFPLSEKKLLEEFLNASESKTDPVLPGSDEAL